jgi:hypothetical protein
MRGMSRVVAARLRSRVKETVLRSDEEHVRLLGISAEAQQICDEVAARRCQCVDQPYADAQLSRLRSAEWCPFGCLLSAHGWREIHPSAVATRDKVSCPRLAKLLLARFGSKFGEIEVVPSHEEEVLGGADIRAGSVIWAGGRWFARAECSPTWWHFHFECTGEPLLAARKTSMR